MIAYGFLFPRFLDQILALVAEQGGELITRALVSIGRRLIEPQTIKPTSKSKDIPIRGTF